MNINGRANDIAYCWDEAGASAFDEIEHTITVSQTLPRPHSQRMSSAANAPLCNIRERKQFKLLSYFPAPQQLCGTRSCGKHARKAHFHGHEHTCTHAEPAHATGHLRHTVQSCSAQAARFWEFFPAAPLRCAAPGCGRRAPKRHVGASTLQHPLLARSRSASAAEGSRKIRATRRAQERRPPRALDAGGAGSRSGLRGMRTALRPAKMGGPTRLHPASSWPLPGPPPRPPQKLE